jgi:hypothetical protein
MPRLLLRSPQYKFIDIPISGVNSCTCEIKINTFTEYILVKNTKKGSTQNFDISELCRDYLDISYQTSYLAQNIIIQTTLRTYDDFNGTGNVVATSVSDDYGFMGYGYFEDGTNPVTANGQYLISKNPDTNEVQLYYPNNTTGIVTFTASSSVSTVSFGATANEIGGLYDSYIKRIDCTKYGDGRRIIFINKYGAQQDLWFFLKETKTLSRKNENYKTNILTYPSGSNATYSISNAPNVTFNTTAKQNFTLSSGYYPQGANNFFEELLLSEHVWIERPNKATGTDEVVPVKVTKSSIQFKTSLNDKLIEYTIDFEEAYDYINNIR